MRVCVAAWPALAWSHHFANNSLPHAGLAVRSSATMLGQPKARDRPGPHRKNEQHWYSCSASCDSRRLSFTCHHPCFFFPAHTGVRAQSCRAHLVYYCTVLLQLAKATKSMTLGGGLRAAPSAADRAALVRPLYVLLPGRPCGAVRPSSYAPCRIRLKGNCETLVVVFCSEDTLRRQTLPPTPPTYHTSVTLPWD